MIEFKNVSFAYGAKPVLVAVSFTVAEHSFAAIIGGSGSGKTTLLKLISGQIFADSGEVLINGKSLRHFSKAELVQHRKNMGYLFQQGALFTDINVQDNIAFPLFEHTRMKPKAIYQQVGEIIKAVALSGNEYLLPNELSGGMTKRVALARAIALQPSLILYDEPFAGLDPITLKKIAELIKSVNLKTHATSIMVTHELQISLQLADKIILLENTQVVFEGSATEFTQSKHPSARHFLAATKLDIATMEAI